MAGAPRGSTWALGLVLLTVALLPTLALAYAQLAGISLPGCGIGSPCAAAAASRWGRVPGIGWPVSYLGTAFFLALLAAWSRAREGAGRSLRAIAVAGGVVSLLYVGVMLGVPGVPRCGYCLATHAANLLFVGVAWRHRAGPGAAGTARAAARPQLALAIALFVLVTAGLALGDRGLRRAARATAEDDLARATSHMVGAPARSHDTFAGRYPVGPPEAAVRVVLFTDYQCPDCLLMEGQVAQLRAGRRDVSFSIKHFPMAADCNPHMRGQTIHANACWAARAAEAAGMLGGVEGFWRMHEWLFGRRGSFTDAELTAGAAQLGLDAAALVRLMQGSEVEARVRADVEEAVALGLSHTPMVFVNGVLLRGWTAPGALVRAVEAVASAGPGVPARGRPPPASDKYLGDWLEQPRLAVPSDPSPRAIGTEAAGVTIVVFGDLLEPNTARVDGLVRSMFQTRSDLRYEFRHFPADQACNPAVPRTIVPGGCLTARAAEAAARAGGPDLYWPVHVWLIGLARPPSETELVERYEALGLETASVRALMDGPEVSAAIATDIAAAEALGLAAVPLVVVNGRAVPHWVPLDGPLLERIVAAAARAGSEPAR
ncbi:MAG TPA: DsbA family protein [Phycisphaerales bacterium]|nr:DsbA family protein [Phycisphaerales bacterium]